MWLLRTDRAELCHFPSPESVPGGYAILSHCWDDEEQTFQDVQALKARCAETGENPRDFVSDKIRRFCILAEEEGHRWGWADMCCINRLSSAELSEAIRSMFRYYSVAAVCYAYLRDVPSGRRPGGLPSKFRRSRWHTRGWTLQELIAPRHVEFLSKTWESLGSKRDLAEPLAEITHVPVGVLTSTNVQMELEKTTVASRLSWAAGRQTTQPEDEAYCLLGILNVEMYTSYGEGRSAFYRLQEELIKCSTDTSLFAWGQPVHSVVDLRDFVHAYPPSDYHDHSLESHLFAPSPFVFASQVGRCIEFTPHEIMIKSPERASEKPRLFSFSMTPLGIQAHVPVAELIPQGPVIASIACSVDGYQVGLILNPCPYFDPLAPPGSFFDTSGIRTPGSPSAMSRLLYFKYEALKGQLHHDFQWREIYIRSRPRDPLFLPALQPMQGSPSLAALTPSPSTTTTPLATDSSLNATDPSATIVGTPETTGKPSPTVQVSPQADPSGTLSLATTRPMSSSMDTLPSHPAIHAPYPTTEAPSAASMATSPMVERPSESPPSPLRTSRPTTLSQRASRDATPTSLSAAKVESPTASNVPPIPELPSRHTLPVQTLSSSRICRTSPPPTTTSPPARDAPPTDVSSPDPASYHILDSSSEANASSLHMGASRTSSTRGPHSTSPTAVFESSAPPTDTPPPTNLGQTFAREALHGLGVAVTPAITATKFEPLSPAQAQATQLKEGPTTPHLTVVPNASASVPTVPSRAPSPLAETPSPSQQPGALALPPDTHASSTPTFTLPASPTIPFVVEPVTPPSDQPPLVMSPPSDDSDKRIGGHNLRDNVSVEATTSGIQAKPLPLVASDTSNAATVSMSAASKLSHAPTDASNPSTDRASALPPPTAQTSLTSIPTAPSSSRAKTPFSTTHTLPNPSTQPSTISPPPTVPRKDATPQANRPPPQSASKVSQVPADTPSTTGTPSRSKTQTSSSTSKSASGHRAADAQPSSFRVVDPLQPTPSHGPSSAATPSSTPAAGTPPTPDAHAPQSRETGETGFAASCGRFWRSVVSALCAPCTK